jgi:cell division septation protein DedD
MAAGDYHNNNFVLKTITAFRICVGVAVTLAVLFAMVWLIDYSREQPAKSYNQQPLLLPEQGGDEESYQAQTFFETLLSTENEKIVDSTVDLKNKPEMGRPSQAAPQPSAVKKHQQPSSAHTPGAALPLKKNQPSQQQSLSEVKAPAVSDVFTVQLGSFQQVERARVFSENMAAKGYQPYIVSRKMPGGTLTYRVRVGLFATREEAMNFASTIERTEKISVFVTAK